MTKEQVEYWKNTGRELEFDYKGKRYSITYYRVDGKRCFSFCEFYKETLDVKDVDTLWNSTYKGRKVSDILEAVPEDEVWVS